MIPEQTRHELLRLLTAGSVDDGKSTLIGRLLHEQKRSTKTNSQPCIRHIVGERTKTRSFAADRRPKAEREQGITIDVAYRYFSHPRRKFIVADRPGHEQYTRNMATGASTADWR